MIDMIVCAKVQNFLPFSLQENISTRGNRLCTPAVHSFLLKMSMMHQLFTVLLFSCKINKFISFSCKNQWKSDGKLTDNLVDIPASLITESDIHHFPETFPPSFPPSYQPKKSIVSIAPIISIAAIVPIVPIATIVPIAPIIPHN